MSTDAIASLNAALEGRYRIERKLGAGGMATVYLADDLKHERRVALKVLKPELAAVVGADRFLAEIKTTANLQHPHILPLFDSGEAGGFLFYVMPYVEGESLRARLDRQHQLPVDEAVQIATNLAEALDYAHRQGVIHRDIKPANVLLQDGKPVVGDFGIALAVTAGGGVRLTETGLSVGTPHYMSPEQATGDLNPGPPTDIYALGCVLYEMLVGEPPYTGSTLQAVLGKIITQPPPAVREGRPTVPAHVGAVVARALEKIPADRFKTASELRQALADTDFRTERKERDTHRHRWRRLAVASSGFAGLLSIGLVWSLSRPGSSPLPSLLLPEPFLEGQAPSPFDPLALTPDGSALVYVGPAGAEDGREFQQLWVRRWDELEGRPLPGTAGPGRISFAVSPDGEDVAFVALEPTGATRELRRISLDGGPPRGLGVRGALVSAWGTDDRIYFHAGRASALGTFRVAASGGERETVAEPEEGEWQLAYVPMDGGSWGVVAVHDVADQGAASAELRAVEPGSGRSAFLAAGHSPSMTTTGHLLYATANGMLMAAPVEGRDVRVERAFQALGHPLTLEPTAERARYTISETGMLVYATGSAEEQAQGQHEFVWVDREGAVTPMPSIPAFDAPLSPNSGFSLSPTDDRIAYQRVVRGNSDIYTVGLYDGIVTRLTFDPAPDLQPRWTPDGERVVFFSSRGNANPFEGHLWTKAADGGDEPTPFFPNVPAIESSWSAGSEWIALRTTAPAYDVLAARPGAIGEPLALATGDEAGPSYYSPAVSPDGRWLAYVSDDGGQSAILIQAFPHSTGAVWQVSERGGADPVWAPVGEELFYIDPARRALVAAEYRDDGSFRVTGRRTLFSIPGDIILPAQAYDVSSDGSRFAMVRSRPSSPPGVHVVLQTNFLASLRAAESR